MELGTVAKISAVIMVTIVAIGMLDTVWRSGGQSGAPASSFQLASTGN